MQILKAKRGFLLIELLIGIAIIAIIAAITTPSLNFLNRQLLATEAEKLHLSFLHMQKIALLENKNKEINFKDNSYTTENQPHFLPIGIRFGFFNNIKGPPASPIQEITNAITFKKKKAVFYENGKVSPGSAYLIDEKNKLMYAVTVPVSEISYVRKYNLKNGSWNLVI